MKHKLASLLRRTADQLDPHADHVHVAAGNVTVGVSVDAARRDLQHRIQQIQRGFIS